MVPAVGANAAVVVSTPPTVAVADAVKAAEIFKPPEPPLPWVRLVIVSPELVYSTVIVFKVDWATVSVY